MRDYYTSIKRSWKCVASSKAKSTQWLLINHALPVKNRLGDRKEVTTCVVCKGQGVDHSHVFNSCPRASQIWEEVNSGLSEKFNVEIQFSFELLSTQESWGRVLQGHWGTH